jgi:hypothetical protein
VLMRLLNRRMRAPHRRHQPRTGRSRAARPKRR